MMASIDLAQLGNQALVVLQVALGLGAVIFVHELGHFAVAKMCGVKCEKFFIGFDIGGYKLSRRWGETEYGIGILPLGGYVKMLGQDDNPANISEQVRQSRASGNDVDAKEIVGPDGETYLVDRRSYLAKTVPQRMAIISAGVIMNVITAFLFAVVAYRLGVAYNPSIVSEVAAGTAAWQADIRPGDEIVKINDIDNPSFNELRGGVTLADLQRGVTLVVKRDDEELTKVVKPRQDGGLARVGIFPPSSLKLAQEQPTAEGSPASKASEPLQSGDEIIAIDGTEVANYAEYAARLESSADQPLKATIRRGDKELVTEIPVHPVRRVGLVMEFGTLAGVQENSPAAALEPPLREGDFIEQFSDGSGEKVGQIAPREAIAWDPVSTPERLRRMAIAFRDVELTVRRRAATADQRPTTETIIVPLRKPLATSTPMLGNDAVEAPALGVAYRVVNRVHSVEPGSPAEQAGMKAGDALSSVEYIYPLDSQATPPEEPIELGEESNNNWAGLLANLQWQPMGTKIKIAYVRSGEQKEAIVEPRVTDDQFVAERGLQFAPLERIRRAASLSEQIERGWSETTSALGMVYRFLSKLGGQVPLTSLGGPLTIVKQAGHSAISGMGNFLTFLTMLSANLAVINFLPIPLLDGGHMAFLLYEGVRGKPASERFVVALHTIGFMFIIGLMLFVLGLDFNLIDRNL